MRLGANSVLFGGYDMETAFKHIAMAGYDGIELAAIDGMSQHLILDRWQELADEIKQLAKTYELDLLAMEQPSRDAEKMEKAFQAAVEIDPKSVPFRFTHRVCHTYHSINTSTY